MWTWIVIVACIAAATLWGLFVIGFLIAILKRAIEVRDLLQAVHEDLEHPRRQEAAISD